MIIDKKILIISVFIFLSTNLLSNNYDRFYLDKADEYIHTEKYDSAVFMLDKIKTHYFNNYQNSDKLKYYNLQVVFNRFINKTDQTKQYTDSLIWFLPNVIPKNGYDSLIVAFAFSNIGNLRFETNQYNESIENFEKAVSFSNSSENDSRARFYQNIGMCYLHLGQTEKGVEYVNKAFRIYESINDIEGKFGCLDYLGNTMVDYRNFELAEKFFNMALEIKDSINNEYQNLGLYNDIGRMYNYEEKFDSALVYFNIALKEAESNKNDFLSAIALTNIGEVLIKQRKYDLAVLQIDKSNQIFKSLGFALGEFQTNHLLAYCKFKQNFFDESKNHQKKAEKILKEIQVYPSLLIDFYKRSYEMKKSFGKTDQALMYLEHYQQLEDSVKNNLINWKINEIESRLLINIRERELAEKNLIIQKHKYKIIIFGAAAFFIVAGFSILILFFKRRKEKQIQDQQEEILHLKLENNRKLISPHFIFNALNHIYSVIDNKELVQKQFNHLQYLIRSTLVNTEKLSIPLYDEIKLVESFTELQQQILKDIEINWNIQQNIDLKQLVPAMILQLPVENAIKHGLWPKPHDRKLWIDVTSDSAYLLLCVTDNGVGLQTSPSPTKGTGTGLMVFSKTIYILNKANERKISFEMHNMTEEEGGPGVKFSIKIPVNYNYNLKFLTS